MSEDTLEKRIKELAEWFCDNPNYQDIEDALREFAEAIRIGKI